LISKTITAKGETFMKYTVILEKGRESGYVASVPALRGCVSQRGNRQEAVAHIKEAIEVYI
jgi:predicted RNase H-like HicB family nuclease